MEGEGEAAAEGGAAVEGGAAPAGWAAAGEAVAASPWQRQPRRREGIGLLACCLLAGVLLAGVLLSGVGIGGVGVGREDDEVSGDDGEGLGAAATNTPRGWRRKEAGRVATHAEDPLPTATIYKKAQHEHTAASRQAALAARV